MNRISNFLIIAFGNSTILIAAESNDEHRRTYFRPKNSEYNISNLTIGNQDLTREKSNFYIEALKKTSAPSGYALEINNCTIDKDAMEIIADYLSNNNLITHFLIDNNDLIDENSAMFLGEALKNNHHLKYLNISYCNPISKVAANEILTALANNKGLTSIFLEGVCFYSDSEGFKNFAQRLQDNKQLTELKINGAEINEGNEKHIKEFANSLKINSMLKKLDLKRNYLLAEDTKLIMQAVNENNNLIELNLSENTLPDEIGEITSSSLEKLILQNCLIDFNQAKKIIKALKNNRTIKTLDLSYNKPICASQIEELRGLMKNYDLDINLIVEQNVFSIIDFVNNER